MSDRERPAPPDWALPGWDAVDPEEPVAGRPTAPRPAEAARPSSPLAAPGTFGLRILQVSEVTRAVRKARSAG